MNPLQIPLPTDSLYKFWALGSLAMIALLYYLTTKAVKELSEIATSALKIIQKFESIKKENKNLKDEFSLTEVKRHKLFLELKDLKQSLLPEQQNEISKLEEEYIQMVSVIEKYKILLNQREIEIKETEDKLKDTLRIKESAEKEIKQMKHLFSIGVNVFFLSSVAGFIFWY